MNAFGNALGNTLLRWGFSVAFPLFIGVAIVDAIIGPTRTNWSLIPALISGGIFLFMLIRAHKKEMQRCDNQTEVPNGEAQ